MEGEANIHVCVTRILGLCKCIFVSGWGYQGRRATLTRVVHFYESPLSRKWQGDPAEAKFRDVPTFLECSLKLYMRLAHRGRRKQCCFFVFFAQSLEERNGARCRFQSLALAGDMLTRARGHAVPTACALARVSAPLCHGGSVLKDCSV